MRNRIAGLMNREDEGIAHRPAALAETWVAVAALAFAGLAFLWLAKRV
jgi:hypothetical protein